MAAAIGSTGSNEAARVVAQAPADEAATRAIAERLARKLTPVVIDLGPDQPRFGSYLDWDEVQQSLLLVPIAGAELGLALAGCRSPIRVRSTDPAEPWMLVARSLRVLSDRMALVELTRGSAISLPARFPGRAQAPGREPLVLAVHAGADGNAIEGHVFPVTSLGASHCLIDASAPLDRGQRLGPVEVIGERRILRRAVGEVIEVIPWITAHGHRRFRCRLALDDAAPSLSSSSSSAKVEAGFDLVSDPDRVAHLFDLGALLGLRGWYDAPGWRRGGMRIGELRDGLAVIEVDEKPPPDAIPLPSEVRLGFELFAISYEGRSRLHRRRGNRFEVALPYVLRRCRRRREQRATVLAHHPVVVTFRNSATGEVVQRAVHDLSFGGLSFMAQGSDLFWKGACLERGRIDWDGQRVALGDLEVRALTRNASGQLVCHVANRGTGPSGHAGFIELLASLHHPEAERHDGTGFVAMVDLYQRAGLLNDFMMRNLKPIIPRATDSWRKLHDARATVACTLLFRGSSAEPQATFSAVRAWEKAWLVQHFGALPTADRRAPGTLQSAYVDFVMPQRDTHYMTFFVRAENSRMNSFHERFFELAGTPEAVTRVRMSRWVLRGDRVSGRVGPPSAAPTVPSPLVLRPIRRADEVVVSHAAERTFGAMAATALSLTPGCFSLPDTARRFGRLGLHRDREVSLIWDGDVVQAALMKENTSPGVNLTWILDAWWFLPVEAYRTGDGAAAAAAAAAIARAPSQLPNADKLLIVPDGTSPAPLLEAGFEQVADLHFYVINRSGFRRYHEYIADRYGELGVKMIKRSAARVARSA
ncbi:MAG TPA: hypothetical protein VFH68_13745 [Polyangia bacterium]|nr:hypothetical protein [Polyangia bacterium]